MLQIRSLNEIQWFVDKIKSAGKNYYTNFYFDEQVFGSLVENGLLHICEYDHSIFLFKKNEGFLNLYFFSNDLKWLEKDLIALNSELPDTFIIDLISKDNSLDIGNVVVNAGFRRYNSLVRMSRLNPVTSYHFESNKNLVYADEVKLGQIAKLFKQYFDPFSERIPSTSELRKWLAENQLIVFSDNGNDVQGFIIFEVKGLTSYLRYWFVHPEYRNCGIGSKLINKYFNESKNTKRQLFWVMESNKNAINRYAHYGFNKEHLVNTVYINKDNTYEGKYN